MKKVLVVILAQLGAQAGRVLRAIRATVAKKVMQGRRAIRATVAMPGTMAKMVCKEKLA